MVPRLSVVLAAGAVACASVAGCGDSQPAATAVTPPSRYIAAVDALLQPPARLASSIAARSQSTTAPVPSRRRLEDLVGEARGRLREFRALRLTDASLRRQRDALAGAYARLIPRMETAADAVATPGDTGLVQAAGPFLDALKALPSDAASSPSR